MLDHKTLMKAMELLRTNHKANIEAMGIVHEVLMSQIQEGEKASPKRSLSGLKKKAPEGKESGNSEEYALESVRVGGSEGMCCRCAILFGAATFGAINGRCVDCGLLMNPSPFYNIIATDGPID